MILFFFSYGADAKNFFNPAFLKNSEQDSEVTDLSYFDKGLLQAPGVYRVDIWVNGKSVEITDVQFKSRKSGIELTPCFDLQKLISLGLNENYYKQNAELMKDPQRCDLISLIPDASVQFDTELQRVNISIPQAALVHKNTNVIPPEQFDQGIPAILLNYKFLGGHTSFDNQSTGQTGYNLSFRPGVNIGAWRLRHYSNWSKTTGKDSRTNTWSSIYTYARRDIIPLHSSLVVGQNTSATDIFDSVGFTGMQLATDEEMEPDNVTGYAPVVRGIAKSNAKVIIRQNGYQIYENYVSPGAFEINDLYQTGSNGDLQVTVQESDGSQQVFIVPYASLPVLRRERSLKYSFTSGVYRTYDSHIHKTPFTQASASYGLPYNSTIYGGTQLSSRYQAIALGLGKNMGEIGAVSVDVTQAWSKKQDEKKTDGQSWRIRYSKNVIQTGTNFAIAGYRYSTAGFNTLSDVLNTYRDDHQVYEAWRVKNRTEMNISQNIGSTLGNISLGGVIEDYWNNKRRNKSISASYSNSWNNISFSFSFSLSYSYVKSIQNGLGNVRSTSNDQLFGMMVSIPLDLWMHSNSTLYAFYNMNTAKPGETTHMAGMTGSTLEDNSLDWSVQQGYGNRSKASGNIDLDYKGTYGELVSSYGYNNQSRRVSYGVSGGAIIHQNGLTLSQPLGESVALVETPGAGGARVSNHPGVRTDFRGYTVVPYVTPYRLNDIVINSETLPDDVELDTTTTTVVPTRGAVVRALFGGRVGIKGFIQLIDRNGNVLPFGATVSLSDSKDAASNFVGEDGRVFLTGLNEQGTLLAKWGNEVNKKCGATYNFKNIPAPSTGIRQIQLKCL